MRGTPDGLILVTGASGFLGSELQRVFQILLNRGFRVRGTVRSQEKLDHVRARYPDLEKLEIEIVEDIASAGTVENALESVTGVIHVASPFFVNPKNNEKDLLRPAIDGTLNILNAAARTSSVRRVVITATMATMSHIGSGPIPGKIYTELDWNPVTWDEAVNSLDGHYIYCAGKTFAEQAAWKFMEVEQPSFDLISINPAWLIGPFLHQVDESSKFNESLRECYENIVRKDKSLPPTIVQYWVDVRDAAKAHIMALEDPVANGRYLVVNRHKFDWKKAFNGIRNRFPERHFPYGNEDYYVQSRPDVDPSKSEKQFGFGWTPLSKSFGDFCAQIYRLQEKGILV
ncbi:related to flavonol reductase/cinnamoyl-CoA reductase [Phialocephala subalpina]|uniref:Related to flavonol reductase/cinnamoyl-CoA reductase n=1 Tax=Phialocephala subalpina TaxID=576137 RepID=A0A1L7WS16_9HELO|nr:related to flavonol reductase/cinnamoyl-CoA reductase [Phialocephala subalpina]